MIDEQVSTMAAMLRADIDPSRAAQVLFGDLMRLAQLAPEEHRLPKTVEQLVIAVQRLAVYRLASEAEG